ncbi:unnamed protein product [Triticum aestivum]|uniref:RNase H type-1 domain-containing protein n=1 Tax=Triticum aestivum TaxID=4565 RepID=A0A7H4LGT7_WHEAT|nr:unnamed protein product [Triticum aestivum]
MHLDGSKMRTGLGAGIVLTSPKGDNLRYTLQIHFAASNNMAEYEALIHGLRLAKELGIRQILCYGDSDLVVQQSSGDWDAKDANMASYRFLVQQISGYFEGCEFLHVPRPTTTKQMPWHGSAPPDRLYQLVSLSSASSSRLSSRLQNRTLSSYRPPLMQPDPTGATQQAARGLQQAARGLP